MHADDEALGTQASKPRTKKARKIDMLHPRNHTVSPCAAFSDAHVPTAQSEPEEQRASNWQTYIFITLLCLSVIYSAASSVNLRGLATDFVRQRNLLSTRASKRCSLEISSSWTTIAY
jgi:hypothetical protein